ncbi:hypothetical protein ACIRBX_18115 [Kitasatospora sp. NPDC096147]|uniref:hypothetical protein n=1 Tax=Kitasatospora sp. NPDC096147 TaxID=3364093 RepID=UPI00382B04BD
MLLGELDAATQWFGRAVPSGIVTHTGPLLWPMADSARLLRFHRDRSADVPDEPTTAVVRRAAPRCAAAAGAPGGAGRAASGGGGLLLSRRPGGGER